jgi:hypothetical protein
MCPLLSAAGSRKSFEDVVPAAVALIMLPLLMLLLVYASIPPAVASAGVAEQE